MTQNSVLSQNWVKCTVHPPLAQPARTAPCHRPGPAVSQRKPGRVACCVVAPLHALLGVSQLLAPYRGASCTISQPVSLPLLLHKCHPKTRYNSCITTLTPNGQALACTRCSLCVPADRIAGLLAMSWPCCGRLVARYWLYRGPSYALLCACVRIQCTVL